MSKTKTHYEKKMDNIFAAAGLTFGKDKVSVLKFQKRFNKLLDKITSVPKE